MLPDTFAACAHTAEQIAWYVELEVQPGGLAEFEALTGEMVASTRTEPGVLAYQRFVSDDRQTVVVYERYADSAAATAHLQRFNILFSGRYARLAKRNRFVVLGNPDIALRELLDSYDAKYLAPFGPFAYWSK